MLPRPCCPGVSDGDSDFACYKLSNLGPQTDCVDVVEAVAGAATVDWSAAPVTHLTISAATTITFTWQTILPSVRNQTGVLIVEKSGAGSALLTWPASVVWPLGDVPAALAAGSTSEFVFQTLDDGTVVLGNIVGVEYS